MTKSNQPTRVADDDRVHADEARRMLTNGYTLLARLAASKIVDATLRDAVLAEIKQVEQQQRENQNG